MIDFSDNKSLFQEIKRGNKKAFESLHKRYYYRLKGYAAKFVDNQQVIDDIIQESFLTIWEKKERLRNVSIVSLLFVIVRNNCLNFLKKKALRHNYEKEYIMLSQQEERLQYIDFGLGVSHKLLHEELEEHIGIVMENLPERCRYVFDLSRNNGLKNREIAEKLNISTTAVEKHISRALLAFSNYFKTNYPIDITY